MDCNSKKGDKKHLLTLLEYKCLGSNLVEDNMLVEERIAAE